MPAHCLVIVDILMHFEMMAMHSEVYYILLEIQSGRFSLLEHIGFRPIQAPVRLSHLATKANHNSMLETKSVLKL